MKKIGNVLSLFDGMSGAQQALNRAGICFENYYSCEIDKFCNQVVSVNFPNTKQLGSVTKVSGYDLPKIDLLVCGSPCQGFSFAGKMLNFSDPRSALFFEAVRILNECKAKNPNILFLFENVRMKLEYELVFTKYLGVEPILINSALLCAQNRNRLYWTNIGAVPSNLFGDLKTTIQQPKDKGIFLRDILESEVDKKYCLGERLAKSLSTDKNLGNGLWKGVVPKNELGKAQTITSRMHKMGKSDNYIKIDRQGNIKENQNKASCFTGGGNSGGNHSDMDLILLKERHKKNFKFESEKSNTFLSTSFKGAQANGMTLVNNSNIRRLTPREVCALQTVNYDSIFVHNGVQIVSDTQIYKMNGNGFTIDVIAYILNHITFFPST